MLSIRQKPPNKKFRFNIFSCCVRMDKFHENEIKKIIVNQNCYNKFKTRFLVYLKFYFMHLAATHIKLHQN